MRVKKRRTSPAAGPASFDGEFTRGLGLILLSFHPLTAPTVEICVR